MLRPPSPSLPHTPSALNLFLLHPTLPQYEHWTVLVVTRAAPPSSVAGSGMPPSVRPLYMCGLLNPPASLQVPSSWHCTPMPPVWWEQEEEELGSPFTTTSAGAPTAVGIAAGSHGLASLSSATQANTKTDSFCMVLPLRTILPQRSMLLENYVLHICSLQHHRFSRMKKCTYFELVSCNCTILNWLTALCLNFPNLFP